MADHDARRRAAVHILSLADFVVLWAVVAAFVASDLLPGPLAVWRAFLVEIAVENYFGHLAATLARVAAAFTVAMAIGVALGGHALTDRLFHAWLVLFLNLPALVTVILCYVWFGLTETAAVTAVAINKIPNVATILREGMRASSRDLAEIATVYRFSPWARVRHLVLPELAPYFAAAARNGLALVRKIVLVVELLGRPNGVGFQLHVYFQ